MGKLKKRITVRGVILSAWDNEATVLGQVTMIPNIIINRAYLDKNGNWQYTANFRESDLPKIKEVIDEYEKGK
jgi:hypothetical protein